MTQTQQDPANPRTEWTVYLNEDVLQTWSPQHREKLRQKPLRAVPCHLVPNVGISGAPMEMLYSIYDGERLVSQCFDRAFLSKVEGYTRVKNTILVYIKDDYATHEIVTEADAYQRIENGLTPASMFTNDGDLDAEFILNVSPELQQKIQAAKDKCQAQWRVHLSMNLHGIAQDPALRQAIWRAIEDVRHFDATVRSTPV